MTDEFGIKGATITIGAVEIQANIVSEFSVSGGETDENVVTAMDGTNYIFEGNQSNFELSFDALIEDASFFEYAYGAGETVGTVTTVVLNDAGSTNDVVVTMPANESGGVLTYYFSGAKGFNAIPKFPFAEGNIATLTLSVTPDNSSVEYDTNA